MPQIKNPISSKSSNKVIGKRAIFPHMDTEKDLWYRVVYVMPRLNYDQVDRKQCDTTIII
jgi:hypothetical protein